MLRTTSNPDALIVNKTRSNRDKTISEVFGEIVWLMSQSEEHKKTQIFQLENLVMPGVLLQQFKIFYNNEQPVGVVLYALVSDIDFERVSAVPQSITSAEWKSGSRGIVVLTVAPFGQKEEFEKIFVDELSRLISLQNI